VPRPADPAQHYVPALDGIRALAVAAVIAFHLGIAGAQGGMLGVGVFFTLSGYLITDLLLVHWQRHGELGLGQFWRRRARRLLPALFLMLVVVSVWVALFDSWQLAAVRRQVLAAVVYMNNWSTIAQHGSYFARFAAPQPLDHLWSLAIEEQFYLVWPWLLLIGIWVARRRWRLAALTLALALGSIVAMALLYHPGYDPTRVYEGTDTRAFALLIGAALAVVWPSRRAVAPRWPAARNILDVLGLLGLVGITLLVWRTNTFSTFLYPYGFVLLSLATAAVLAAAVNRSGRIAAALGWAPLRWIGVRSYGIYLWQWPVIVLANTSQKPFAWSRAVLEVAVTTALAALSWRFVEDPIRHGALGRIWARVRPAAAALSPPRRVLAASGGLLAALCLPAISLSGLLPAASASREHNASLLTHVQGAIKQDPAAAAPTAAADVFPIIEPPPTKTACRSVVYIGDSTSEGEVSTDYIPDPSKRLQAQLADVGVATTFPEISGARSIVETFQGNPDAAAVARQYIAQHFNGCWIFALGTNEAADVAAGSNASLAQRISEMMSIVGSQPVLWVDAVTLVGSGPYAESGMQDWNHDLALACRRYPNMRVFDWAAHARTQWFIPDGIHYYSPGYVARAHLIARAMVNAFPRGQQASADCIVS